MTDNTNTNGPNGSQIEQVVRSIVDTTAERDALREETRRLRIEVSDLTRRLEFFTHELQKITTERDFFQIHSVSLHTRLTDISVLISQALEEAKNEAYRRGKTPVPEITS